jgi:hypothetical protein
MNPWDEFAARIELDPDVFSIYPAMAQGIVPPAVIIVPADPWIVSTGFEYDTEAYLAICLAEAGNPSDALDRIHLMVHGIRDASGDGWEIGDVSGVRNASIPDDGTRYLGAWVNLTYRNCDHTVEEGS